MMFNERSLFPVQLLIDWIHGNEKDRKAILTTLSQYKECD